MFEEKLTVEAALEMVRCAKINLKNLADQNRHVLLAQHPMYQVTKMQLEDAERILEQVP